jgi:hypothetical protein
VYSHEIDVLTLVQVHLAVQDYTPESTSVAFCMLCNKGVWDMGDSVLFRTSTTVQYRFLRFCSYR